MLRKGLKFHDLTQRLCREYDFFPKAIYESDNLDTVYSLVSHNYGVAFLPSTLLPVLTKKDSNVRFYPLASKKRPAPHRHCLPRDKIQGKEDAGPGEGDQKPVTWHANCAKLMDRVWPSALLRYVMQGLRAVRRTIGNLASQKKKARFPIAIREVLSV